MLAQTWLNQSHDALQRASVKPYTKYHNQPGEHHCIRAMRTNLFSSVVGPAPCIARTLWKLPGRWRGGNGPNVSPNTSCARMSGQGRTYPDTFQDYRTRCCYFAKTGLNRFVSPESLTKLGMTTTLTVWRSSMSSWLTLMAKRQSESSRTMVNSMSRVLPPARSKV